MSNKLITLGQIAKQMANSIQKQTRPSLENLEPMQLFKLIFPHWLTAKEWEAKGKPKQELHLYPWQEELIDDVFNPLIKNYEQDDLHVRIAVAGAYGTGKSTALAIIIILHICFCYIYDKKRIYKGSVYSGSEIQLRETLWDEVRVHSAGIRGLAHECKKMYVDRPALDDRDPRDPNFYRITAETINNTNAGTKRGKHGGNVLVVFDEGTNMSEEMYNTVDTFGTNCRRVWLVTSNPTTTIGRFYQFFSDDFYKTIWKTKHISVFDSYPEGHNFAYEMIAKHGEESDDVRIAVYGQFPKHSTGSIFPPYLVEMAIERGTISNSDLCALGVDLATDRGKDYTTICVKRPFCYASVHKFKMPTRDFLRDVLYDFVLQYRPTFVAVDRGGIGDMPAQELAVFCQNQGIKLIPVDFGGRPNNDRYYNRRTELLFIVRERLQDGYGMCDNSELREEMSWLTYGDDYRKIKAVSKDELKRSTDLLDALSLTEASDMMTPAMAQYIAKQKAAKERIARNQRAAWGVHLAR